MIKYIVDVHAEIVIEGVEIEVGAFDEEDMAEAAIRQWLSSLRGNCASKVQVSNEELENWNSQ